jgi:hypothetical protein
MFYYFIIQVIKISNFERKIKKFETEILKTIAVLIGYIIVDIIKVNNAFQVLSIILLLIMLVSDSTRNVVRQGNILKELSVNILDLSLVLYIASKFYVVTDLAEIVLFSMLICTVFYLVKKAWNHFLSHLVVTDVFCGLILILGVVGYVA